jgi:DNA-binding transcriptional LysR family regulator
MDVDLRLLRHARALAIERSFARAARAVGLTQPALSRSIQELERRAGTRLFVRDRRGVEPTDAGNVFLEAAAEVVARADDLGRQMTLLRGLDVGTLVVGSGPYPAGMFVGEATARTIRAHEGLRVRILVDQYPALAQALRRRECDLVVAERVAQPLDEEVETHDLCRHQGYFVVRAGHPLLSIARPELQEILAYPVAATGRLPPRLMKPLVSALPRRIREEFGSKPFPRVECSSLSVLKTVVAETDAVGLFTLTSVLREVTDGHLSVVDRVEPWLQTNFGVVWPRRRALSPSARTFIEQMAELDAGQLAAEDRLAATVLGTRRTRARRLGSN